MNLEINKNSLLTDANKLFLSSIRKISKQLFPFVAINDLKVIQNSLYIANSLKNRNIYDFMGQFVDHEIISVLGNSPAYFDHVGFEVLGSLKEYLTILQNIIPSYERDSKLFESVQLYNMLKKYDQALSKVDILKLHTNNGNIIELFSCHQHHTKTMDREKYGSKKSTMRLDVSYPLSHIAIRIEDIVVFQNLVNLLEKKFPLSIYGEGVYYNPGDMSYNIKLIIKDHAQYDELDTQIYFLEFIFITPKFE